MNRDEQATELLRRVSGGESLTRAAVACGVNRKTVYRWRTSIPGFGDKLDQAMAMGGSPPAIKLVSGGAKPDCEPQTPDVLAPDGRVLVAGEGALVSGERVLEPDAQREGSPPGLPYPSERPPTRDEWIAMMTRLAMDPTQPDRLRAAAMGSVTLMMNAGAGRSTRAMERASEVAAASERATLEREAGREAGIPASVWREARQNFLGPAPAERIGAGEREHEGEHEGEGEGEGERAAIGLVVAGP